MKESINFQKGFSLVEIIIVVGIFSATISAIFALVMKNIDVQKHNKSFLVASMLSQEALEMSRKIRDENWRTDPQPIDGAWEGLTQDFIIDYRVGSLTPANDSDGDGDITDEASCQLFLNASGFYDHGPGGTPTKFYRLVRVVDNTDVLVNPDNPFLELNARVQWLDEGVRREYIASTLLYDWK
jgi:prepilin-type N-terminal cleavage/methylation domain-containing protein